MSDAVISPKPKFTSIDENGNPRVGAKLYTYESGTTTPKTTWTDATKSTANPNPIILDSNGQADVWIDCSDGPYRFKLTDENDVVLWTKDNISQPLDWTTSSYLDPPDRDDELMSRDASAELSLKRLKIGTLLGNVYFPNPGAADQGVVGSGDTMKAAVDDAGSDEAVIVLRHSSGGSTTVYTLSTDLTIPSNVRLVFQYGSRLSVSGGVTLTLNQAISAGEYRIFEGGGSIAWGINQLRLPQWDDAAGIGLIPALSDEMDLGRAANKFRDIHLSRDIHMGGTIYASDPIPINVGIDVDGDIGLSGNLIPESDETTDLGTSSKKIDDAHIKRLHTYYSSYKSIFGLELQYNDGAQEDLTVQPGSCKGSDGLTSGVLLSAITKQTDASWAEGTNQGGVPSGVTISGSTWYHVHALINPATLNIDVGFDSSVTAANLLADSNVQAAGYTKYRRIGSIYVASTGPNVIRKFLQLGNIFWWGLPYASFSGSFTNAYQTLTLLVPDGVEVAAILGLAEDGASYWVNVVSYDGNTPTPNVGYNTLAPGGEATMVIVKTNTSRQVKYSADTTGSSGNINTLGWIDPRM